MNKVLDYFSIEGAVGGSQEWFRNVVMYIGGCAAATACDCCIYLALHRGLTKLYPYDVHKLTEILRRLAADGNTVIVIEHNLDVIKTADYIIDIGPEGGDKGGTVVACGTPEEVAENEKSYTGKYIDAILKKK